MLKNLFRMIRIAMTPAAYEAICSTLPQGAPLWPVQRQGGQCLIGRRRPPGGHARAGRGLSDVILRLIEAERV